MRPCCHPPTYYPTRWDLGEIKVCEKCGSAWAVGWGYDREIRARRPMWRRVKTLSFIPLVYRAVRKGNR